jgi:transcriptional regulator with XRE-family HTH domain
MEHVRALYAKGMSSQAMADQAGLNDRTIRAYINGYIAVGDGQRRPVIYGTVVTLEKILALKFKRDWTAEGFRPDLLRAVRESKGFSRRALGRAAGICPETIQYWEIGKNLPSRKKNVDAVLAILGIGWEQVSGSGSGPEDDQDAFSMVFSDGVLDAEADYIPDYPCLVCGGTFRSRLMLAQHPHARKKVSV